MKKASLLLTTFVMILSFFIPNLASAKSFPDVQTNHWAYKEINYLTERGIINGTPEGYFKPSDNVTRGQMAVALVKAFDLKSTGAHVRFKDVPFTHWAYDYVVILAQNNITVGFPDGSFAPTAKVTREQFAAFLARLQEPSFRPVRN